jgi:arylsulfatase A-like enzyme
VHSHLDFEGIKLKSLRSMDKKYIEANEGNKRHYAPEEMYDLKADPGEQVNIAGKPESAGELTLFKNNLATTDQAIAEKKVPPSEFDTENLPQELKDQLEAVGYGKAKKE